jgi:hypothetical protein
MPWLLTERDPPGGQAETAGRPRQTLLIVVSAVALLTSACAARSVANEPAATTAGAPDHQVLHPPGVHHMAALAAGTGRPLPRRQPADPTLQPGLAWLAAQLDRSTGVSGLLPSNVQTGVERHR